MITVIRFVGAEIKYELDILMHGCLTDIGSSVSIPQVRENEKFLRGLGASGVRKDDLAPGKRVRLRGAGPWAPYDHRVFRHELRELHEQSMLVNAQDRRSCGESVCVA